MRAKTNTKLKPAKKVDLQVVKPVKTTKYSDDFILYGIGRLGEFGKVFK